MKLLQRAIIRLADACHPLLIIALIVGFNGYWTITLSMFGRQFEQIAGVLPLDLLNVERILSPAEALAQIAAYTAAAKTLYWSFFILDTIMPPLAFGVYALLWVYIFRRNPNRLFDRLLASPLILVPLGVGLFDWFENLCFIVALTVYPEAGALPALTLGLVFVRLKAACLFATFGLTLLLGGFHLVNMARRRWRRVTAGWA